MKTHVRMYACVCQRVWSRGQCPCCPLDAFYLACETGSPTRDSEGPASACPALPLCMGPCISCFRSLPCPFILRWSLAVWPRLSWSSYTRNPPASASLSRWVYKHVPLLLALGEHLLSSNYLKKYISIYVYEMNCRYCWTFLFVNFEHNSLLPPPPRIVSVVVPFPKWK